METDPKELLKKHEELIHSEMKKVLSHVQRKSEDWILNTVMLEGHEVPFKYKRKQEYKSLKGQCVNLTYYPATESIAGMDVEIMKVIRIKRA